MNLHERKWMALLGATVMTLASGCGTDTAPVAEPQTPASEPAVESTESLHPERRGIGILPLAERPGPSAMSITVDPRRSLVVTDQVILNAFPFHDVMKQLVVTSGTATSPLGLFQQWWDTARPSPGLGLGPNCNSPGVANMNGFLYGCPRAEGNQATVDPFPSPATNPNAYAPIGLFNRFDLAPANGADCGEYRIVFAKRSGFTNGGDRNLIIFEAVLLNPQPAMGLAGCQPVARFWADLSNDPDPVSRSSKLRNFYFTGLPGFMPVIHTDNVGGRPAQTGQVRTNMFMQSNWMLREYKLRRDCSVSPCVLRFIPVTVKTNPGGTLFNPGSTHALAPNFQSAAFPGQVPNLAINDINLFNMVTPDAFNSGQSNAESPTENHYMNQFGTAPSAFRTNVQSQLTALPSALTPDNMVARAMALSCAGCHQLSNGANLGGGLIWPSSQRFTHVNEYTEPGPWGTRHQISPALINVFIPHRKAVFETYLNSSCGDAVCDAWETHASCSADCP